LGGISAGGPGHGFDDHGGDGGCIVQGHQAFQVFCQFGPVFGLALGEGIAGQVMGVAQVVDAAQG